MSDMIAFGYARLDEEEAAAKAAKQGRWTADHWERGWRVLDGPDELKATLVAWSPGPVLAENEQQSRATADYIAGHDPARELRDIEHKRAILAAHAPVGGFDGELHDAMVCGTCGDTSFITGEFGGEPYPCATVRRLIARWDDHPDFKA